MNSRLERFRQFSIVSSEFTERLCFFLKDGGDAVHRVAYFELFSKRMINQLHPCLLFVILQGDFEEKVEGR